VLNFVFLHKVFLKKILSALKKKINGKISKKKKSVYPNFWGKTKTKKNLKNGKRFAIKNFLKKILQQIVDFTKIDCFRNI